MYCPQTNILIYHDKESRTHIGTWPQVLYKTFSPKPVKISYADRHHFPHALKTSDPKLIVLPEILGEESYYSRHISLATQESLHNWVFQGGILLTFCASTYWMGEKITYHPPKGPTKLRSGCHVFNAAALKMHGPLPGYWVPSNGKPDFGGCRSIPLIVRTEEGLKRDKVWYGNGPAIFSSSAKELPSNFEPFAYYDRIEDYPIAAGELKVGKGRIIMSGPLPHYAQGEITHNNLLWQAISNRLHGNLFASRKVDMIRSIP